MADPPSSPTSLNRVVTGDVGTIQVKWSAPLDDGGTPIKGYILNIDDKLEYDGGNAAGVTAFTISKLALGKDYLVEVWAVNAIGLSSSAASLVTSAAAVPSRPPAVEMVNATATQI